MPKQVYAIAGVLTGLLLLAVLGLVAHYRGAELNRVQSELEEARAALGTNSLLVTNLQTELTGSQARAATLEQESLQLREELQKHETARKTQQSMFNEMRAQLDSREVTISEPQGKLTVTRPSTLLTVRQDSPTETVFTFGHGKP